MLNIVKIANIRAISLLKSKVRVRLHKKCENIWWQTCVSESNKDCAMKSQIQYDSEYKKSRFATDFGHHIIALGK